ncbi:hypothetical protein MIND_00558000 [Mycena indigotica]|uniref:Uncharacterized protein n=1 Tax=Mycena indigotica TaxID=2126181 RepID=A0A8H6SYH3_9AGAR|nr:uncharacterized protein MIND_00558000 [Mycena indigotica]KAF7307628.1 hypothetical protein MIND_00558000 [Mycena indigotica]
MPGIRTATKRKRGSDGNQADTEASPTTGVGGSPPAKRGRPGRKHGRGRHGQPSPSQPSPTTAAGSSATNTKTAGGTTAPQAQSSSGAGGTTSAAPRHTLKFLDRTAQRLSHGPELSRPPWGHFSGESRQTGPTNSSALTSAHVVRPLPSSLDPSPLPTPFTDTKRLRDINKEAVIVLSLSPSPM